MRAKKISDNNMKLTEAEIKELKLEEQKRNNRIIIKYLILGIIILVVAAFAIKIIPRLLNHNAEIEYIKMYCDDTDYKYKYTAGAVAADYSCGTLAIYLKYNKVTTKAAEDFITYGSEELYKDFKKIKDKELIEYLDITSDSDIIINVKFLDYIYNESDYKPPVVVYENALNFKFSSEEYDDWKDIVKYMSKYNYKWNDADDYFTDGYGYQDIDYDKRFDRVIKNKEFSKYYHEVSKDYKCFATDFYDSEILKNVFTNSEEKTNACNNVFLDNVSNFSLEAIKNYLDLKGNVKSENYLGNAFHFLVRNFKRDSDASIMAEKIKLLKNAGVDINKQMNGEQSDPGYTPLDKFIYSNYSYPSAEQIKFYRALKNNGAKCNKSCNYEKNFKVEYEYD